jgi:sec-independent protein translocase protein TatA
MIGVTEILIIGGVVFVLFGAKSIPKFARSIGQAKKEFQNGLKDEAEEPAEKSANTIETEKA